MTHAPVNDRFRHLAISLSRDRKQLIWPSHISTKPFAGRATDTMFSVKRIIVRYDAEGTRKTQTRHSDTGWNVKHRLWPRRIVQLKHRVSARTSRTRDATRQHTVVGRFVICRTRDGQSPKATYIHERRRFGCFSVYFCSWTRPITDIAFDLTTPHVYARSPIAYARTHAHIYTYTRICTYRAYATAVYSYGGSLSRRRLKGRWTEKKRIGKLQAIRGGFRLFCFFDIRRRLE